jgi:hypothetical protein
LKPAFRMSSTVVFCMAARAAAKSGAFFDSAAFAKASL